MIFFQSIYSFFFKAIFFGLIASFVVLNCATGTSRFKQVLLDTTAHSKTIFSNPAKTFVALTAGGPSISKKLKQLLELGDDLNLRVRVIVNEIKQLRVRYIEFEGAEKK
ncbi:MAG: hypothetical protein QJQ54_01820 [Mollicutes bacterium]|nr:MAG: hypothetical protein QJQ54_01820 [Mollicutes bacterium]